MSTLKLGNPVFYCLFGIVCFTASFVLAHSHWMASSFGGQALCIAVAVLWIAALRIFWIRRSSGRSIHGFSAVSCIGSLLPAFVLRNHLLRFLPPPNQAGFEEVLCGSYSFRVFQQVELLPKWRFSSALGALGWKIAGEISLEALRIPTIVLGYAGLFFLYLCLDQLRVGAWVSLVVIGCMATMKFMVYATGGTMWFNYFGVSLLPLLFLFLLRLDSDDGTAPVWACLAGVVSGAFVYEYAPFQFFAAFAGFWVIWIAFRGHNNANAFIVVSSYSVGFGLLITPLLCHIANFGLGHYLRQDLLEPFFRYRSERSGPISARFGLNVASCLKVLFGRVGGGDALLETPESAQIHPLVGALFFVSLLAALSKFRKQPFVFALALLVLIGSIVTSAAKNVFTPNHLAGFVPVLLLLSAVFLADVDSGVRALSASLMTRAGSKRPFFAFGRAATYTGLFFLVAFVNTRGLIRTVSSERVLREFDNNEYVVCRHIALRTRQGQTVLLIAEREMSCGGSHDSRWLSGEKDPAIVQTSDLPNARSIVPGTLVVHGSVGTEGIPQSRLAEFRRLAEELQSSGTYGLSRNALGTVRAASFCYRCSVGRITL